VLSGSAHVLRGFARAEYSEQETNYGERERRSKPFSVQSLPPLCQPDRPRYKSLNPTSGHLLLASKRGQLIRPMEEFLEQREGVRFVVSDDEVNGRHLAPGSRGFRVDHSSPSPSGITFGHFEAGFRPWRGMTLGENKAILFYLRRLGAVDRQLSVAVAVTRLSERGGSAQPRP